MTKNALYKNIKCVYMYARMLNLPRESTTVIMSLPYKEIYVLNRIIILFAVVLKEIHDL